MQGEAAGAITQRPEKPWKYIDRNAMESTDGRTDEYILFMISERPSGLAHAKKGKLEDVDEKVPNDLKTPFYHLSFSFKTFPLFGTRVALGFNFTRRLM